MTAAALGGLMVVSQGMVSFAVEASDMNAGSGTDVVLEEDAAPQQGAGIAESIPAEGAEPEIGGIASAVSMGVGLDLSNTAAEPEGDACVLEDIQLSFTMPEYSVLKNAEDKYFYYIYSWDGEGIPDIMVGAINYSSLDGFFDQYTEYMKGSRPDLTVAEPESDVTIGDKALRKIVYNYSVQGYPVQDTRYIWAKAGIIYMFTKREVPSMGYTMGTWLEDIIASARCLLDDQPETTAPQPETTAPQPETTAPQLETTAPQPETTAPTGTTASYEPSADCVQNADKSWNVTTDYYTMTIPAAWTGHFEVSRTETTDPGYSLHVINTESKDAGYGGEIFNFWLIGEGLDYSYLPSYDYLGTMATPNGNYSVIVMYPTDVQTSEMWSQIYDILYGDKNSAITSVRPKAGVVWTLPDGTTLDGNATGSSQTGADTTNSPEAQTTSQTEVSSTVPTTETSQDEESRVLGSTSGNTYTNAEFGFSYTLPEGWIMASQDQLVTLNNGVTADQFFAHIEAGTPICTAYSQSADGMEVMNVVEQSGATLMDPGQTLTQDDMMAILTEAKAVSTSSLESLGAEVTSSGINTVTFMGQTFHSLDITFNYSGYSGTQKQIGIVSGQRIAMITVRSVSGDNTQAMLDMFSAI